MTATITTSTPIATALALRAQLDQEAAPPRPAIPPGPGVAAPELPRHLVWSTRLRAVAALAPELEDLEACAMLCSSSRTADLRGAGEWLDQVLDGLVAVLEAPTVDGLTAALCELAAADQWLRDLIAARKAVRP